MRNSESPFQPLAARMRPRALGEVLGQPHLLGTEKPLTEMARSGHIHSFVMWGPPGTGKTTVASLVAEEAGARFVSLSAVLAGVKDVRAAVAESRRLLDEGQQATILFVDEVHRFSKSQQDAFLPHMEDGTITLIGATTENPSFELNNALLSRTRIFVFKSMDQESLLQLIDRALQDEKNGYGELAIEISQSLREDLAQAADGDARRVLNLLELAVDLAEMDGDRRVITTEVLATVFQSGHRRFDKGGDIFYDQISALHKSIRGSSVDAALYWLARMLDGGCDPRYLARRLLRIASEDIGNADPRALQISLSAWEAYERLGSPEGELAIAQSVAYLASAPKSNAVYQAFSSSQVDARKYGSLEVPVYLRNAPTSLTKQLGHGKAYRYAHDEQNAYAAGERYFPEGMPEQVYYSPVPRGLEIKIGEKLTWQKEQDRQARKSKTDKRRTPRKKS